jgi:gluconolactonase
MLEVREITTGLQFPEGPVAMPDGSVLVVEIARRCVTRVQADGTKAVVATPGGGPNGLAIGPDGKCYVCNNGGFEFTYDQGYGLRPALQAWDYSGGRIERIDLATGEVEVLYRGTLHAQLRGPNDIVFDAHGGFYFTDLGKVRARLGPGRGVLRPGRRLAAARGRLPAGDAERDRSVARRQHALCRGDRGGAPLGLPILKPGVLGKQPWPSPHGGRLVADPGGRYQRFDSLAVEADGNICVATLIHGGITVISPDGAAIEHLPMPDLYTTNICFGGPDLRTAYITLSNSGRLVALDWPRPGLPLHHLNQ